MGDRTQDRDHTARQSDGTRRDGATRTGAGQEATKGTAPEQHDDESQSDYGGGGPNGGSSRTKK